MSADSPGEGATSQATKAKKPRPPLSKRLKKRWRNAKRSVARSTAVTRGVGALVYHGLRLVEATQKPAKGSSDARAIMTRERPAIVALWHGQHLLAPLFRPRELPFVALLSKNADAEINALVVERFGIDTERGSGGRIAVKRRDKGGARAAIALKRRLSAGQSVCMIADIPNGTPREAGLGIITLAKISGRPILPAAAVTSRRHVVASSWDRTTIPLPFGRIAVVLGDPIAVPADADEAMMEARRKDVTEAIEAANRRATELADAAP